MKTKKSRLNKLLAGIIVVTLCIGGVLGFLDPKTYVSTAEDSAEEYTDYLLNDTRYKIQDYSQSLIGSKAHSETT